jgi:predicted dehydrogenase
MRAVRVGVVGTGFGRRVVAPAFAAAGCEITDVVSARDERAVAELCATDVDLVSIHSPPFLHATHVGLALEHGHAVLCEKPFGRSSADAEAMTAAAEMAGVIALVNFEFRHEPARVELKHLLDGGAIGRPEHLQWTALNSGSRAPLRRYGWLFDRSLGGGWIGAWGSHAVDAIRWLLGEVTDAGAETRVTITERPDGEGHLRRCDAEDAFSAWLRLTSGATAAIDTSFAAPVSLSTRVTILGDEGAIELTNDRRISIRGADGAKDERELPKAAGDPHDVAMRRWALAVCGAVRDREPIRPSFADGLACARVLDAFRSVPEADRTPTRHNER